MVRRRVVEGETGGGRRRPGAAHCAGGRAPEAGQGSRGARKRKGVRIEPGTDLQYQRKIGTSLKRTCNF
jgi:hypothetical protein